MSVYRGSVTIPSPGVARALTAKDKRRIEELARSQALLDGVTPRGDVRFGRVSHRIGREYTVWFEVDRG